jgi:hypothetical protein
VPDKLFTKLQAQKAWSEMLFLEPLTHDQRVERLTACCRTAAQSLDEEACLRFYELLCIAIEDAHDRIAAAALERSDRSAVEISGLLEDDCQAQIARTAASLWQATPASAEEIHPGSPGSSAMRRVAPTLIAYKRKLLETVLSRIRHTASTEETDELFGVFVAAARRKDSGAAPMIAELFKASPHRIRYRERALRSLIRYMLETRDVEGAGTAVIRSMFSGVADSFRTSDIPSLSALLTHVPLDRLGAGERMLSGSGMVKALTRDAGRYRRAYDALCDLSTSLTPKVGRIEAFEAEFASPEKVLLRIKIGFGDAKLTLEEMDIVDEVSEDLESQIRAWQEGRVSASRPMLEIALEVHGACNGRPETALKASA